MSRIVTQISQSTAWSDSWEYRSQDEQDISLFSIAEFINADLSIRTLEDWSCGKCIFQKYFRPDINYTGLDITRAFQDVNLTEHVSDPPANAIFIRNVLEHNEDWRSILKNLLQSFSRKAIIIVSTPFSDDQKGGDIYRSSGYNSKGEVVNIPDIQISRVDFEQILHDNEISYKICELNKSTVYYLTKNMIRE